MKIPEVLLGAIRQYRHNCGDNSFLTGFDKEETITIVNNLIDKLNKLSTSKKERIMELEIQKTLVLSTAHITKTDDTLLGDVLREQVLDIVIVDEDFGWKVHTHSLSRHNTTTLKRAGFSDDFIKCLMVGFINDCEWVCFDADGPQHNFLNIHEW